MDISYTGLRQDLKILQSQQEVLQPSCTHKVSISFYFEGENLMSRVFFCGCQLEVKINPSQGDLSTLAINQYISLLPER